MKVLILSNYLYLKFHLKIKQCINIKSLNLTTVTKITINNAEAKGVNFIL